MSAPLVLGSASPRRQELLAALGLRFTVVASDLDEAAIAGDRAPEAAALAVADAKGAAIAARHPDAVVLAADTIVVLDGRVLGKPTDAADARRMLAALRDRVHLVITGISVRRGARHETVAVPAEVTMRGYTDIEIARYVADGGGVDRAGAYGIQDEPFRPVAAIAGCWCNVMGLPLWTAARMLQRAGCVVPRSPDEAFARCAVCPLRDVR
jgi:MAF protein